jgi:predicted AAA+ superfamily ATPase
MDKSKLRQVIIDQQERFRKDDGLIARDVDLKYLLKGKEMVVVTGIRRCGKSSLLKLIAAGLGGSRFFMDFDDVRLSDFEVPDYQHVEELALELCGEGAYYFLDEIQNAPLWERWVNNLYGRDVKIFMTGSNSSLLSSEISTFLTGRNKQLRLDTFSFREFLRLRKINYDLSRLSSAQKASISKMFREYFEVGGFPLVLKNSDPDLSRQYFADILNKDVMGRHKIREVKGINDLALFLLSNVGKRYSYSTLKQVSGIKSLSTIKKYVGYFQESFLVYTVGLFDYSVRKQKVSSSKAYAGDNGFLKTVAFNFTENLGQRLENLVFLHLKRLGLETYYYAGKKECDFVAKRGIKVEVAIQVAASLDNPKTKEREVDGLLEAMRLYKLDKGVILTFEEEGVIKKGNHEIEVLPVWKWLISDDGVKVS